MLTAELPIARLAERAKFSTDHDSVINFAGMGVAALLAGEIRAMQQE